MVAPLMRQVSYYLRARVTAVKGTRAAVTHCNNWARLALNGGLGTLRNTYRTFIEPAFDERRPDIVRPSSSHTWAVHLALAMPIFHPASWGFRAEEWIPEVRNWLNFPQH